MTRDEAVKKIAREGYISIEHAEDLYDEIIPKPVVPQYVADWYEKHKDNFEEYLCQCIHDVVDFNNRDEVKDFKDWLSIVDGFMKDEFKAWMSQAYENGAIKTLINMHQFGYEVEKDPRYKVTFKGLNINKHLCCNWTRENWYLWCEKESKMCHTSHTRKELEEAGFGWVFDCEGVEVKEVE